MIELGHFAAFLALAAALAQGMFGLTGQRRMAGLAAYAGFAVMILSFVTLIVAFARSDFSVALVANNSHTLKPMIYKIAGAWGNHEGSMALWCLVTLGFGAAGALWMRTGRDLFEARALGIQGLLAVGALAYLLFASSPFLRLDPAPFQGAGLNPLLQDPALSIHPPMLYLGYVGYSFVFALAAAGLMEARVDSVWAKEARRWSLAAFIPLTLGIALGSYWAYYELGWGGWWFWDPVENASLMPWLIGAALLHSVVVTEKREGFGAWSALLAVLAFLFSIMGAFLVRSGILTSVHAFAVDPERGMLLLFGLLPYGDRGIMAFGMRGNVYVAEDISACRTIDPMDFDPFMAETVEDNAKLADMGWRHISTPTTEGLFGGRGPQARSGGSPFGGAQHRRPPQKGADIAYKLRVPFIDAATLKDQRITLSDGKTIDLKLPAGVESGTQMRLRGKGEPGPQRDLPAHDAVSAIESVFF